MPMPSYPVICYGPNCEREAVYKVAARWSDGVTGELKTYFLSCPDCLPHHYRRAKTKRTECRLAFGESLDLPAIFHLTRGERDRTLVRCSDLEERFS